MSDRWSKERGKGSAEPATADMILRTGLVILGEFIAFVIPDHDQLEHSAQSHKQKYNADAFDPCDPAAAVRDYEGGQEEQQEREDISHDAEQAEQYGTDSLSKRSPKSEHADKEQDRQSDHYPQKDLIIKGIIDVFFLRLFSAAAGAFCRSR